MKLIPNLKDKDIDKRTNVWLIELQQTWEKFSEADLSCIRHRNGKGICSSQIAALVRMLVERGILD